MTARNGFTEALHFLRSYLSDEPSYLIFFVTAVCNARCKHCFYWRETGAAQAGRELGLPEIEQVARSLPRLIYLSLGGGEPFTRKDLAEVVRVFYERSGILYANVVTNGFYTERTVETVREILDRCPRLRLKVQVSIDDFEKEHDENRGVPGLYRKALETLGRLSREFRGRHPRFGLDVATCLTRTNKARAAAIPRSLRREVEFDSFSFLYPRGPARAAAEKEVTAAEYESAIRILEEEGLGGNHNPMFAAVHRVARRGILKVLERDEHPWRCLAGKKFVSLTERGVLQPCEVLRSKAPGFDSDIADLAASGFDVRRALAGAKAREVRGFIEDSRCRCSFECAAMNNVVFDPRYAARALWRRLWP